MPSSLKSIVWTAAACIVVAMAAAQVPPAPPAIDAPNARRAGEKEIVWLTDEAEMVLVPEGKALVPELDERKPKREMTLPAFYIDKYEVTNARFVKFMQTVKEAPENYLAEYPKYNGLWLDEGRWEVKPGRENFPAAVTFEGAVAFCKWAGKDLPDWPQFMRAACGDDGRKYPWGNEWDPAKSVCSETPRADGEYGPCAVGSRPTGASPFGAQDMVGNVYEWVRLPAGFMRTPPGGGPTDRIVAGGSYETTGRSWDANPETMVHPVTCSWCMAHPGFRCVIPADRVRAEAAKEAK